MRDLEVVLAVAETGKTTEAARKIHLTQSAVSRAIAVAEDKLEVRLFARSRDGLTLTDAGKRLVAGAAPLLAALAELERAVANVQPQTRLAIVCECYTAYRWLPSTLAELRRKLPRLDLVLALEHTLAPAEALRDGVVDVALLTTARVEGAGKRGPFVERALFTDEVSFVVARSHPLAQKKSISPADLAEYGIVTGQAPPAEMQWFVNAVFGRRRPRVATTTFPLTEAVFDSARAGMGVAVMSEWIASAYVDRGDLVVKRLARGPLLRPWRIAYRRELADDAELFAATLGPSLPRVRVA